jgi:hypothetical protein
MDALEELLPRKSEFGLLENGSVAECSAFAV